MRGRPVPGIDDGRPGRAVNADTAAVVAELRSLADPSRRPGMAHVGITIDRALGVSIPKLRRMARAHRGDHELALDLWATEIHEARILASMVDDPALVTRSQMDTWATDFDSWDLCDQVCTNLFQSARSADAAARAWCRRDEEYVKRAAFAIAAAQAVHDRDRGDDYFIAWFPRIRAGRDRRAQRREEGGELGAATDRQAEPRTATMPRSPRRKRLLSSTAAALDGSRATRSGSSEATPSRSGSRHAGRRPERSSSARHERRERTVRGHAHVGVVAVHELHADVVGSCVAVFAHACGDRLLVPPGDRGVDESVAPAVDEIARLEPQRSRFRA